MTKTAEKPYPLGSAHTYIAHIRESLPPREFNKLLLPVAQFFPSDGNGRTIRAIWDPKQSIQITQLIKGPNVFQAPYFSKIIGPSGHANDSQGVSAKKNQSDVEGWNCQGRVSRKGYELNLPRVIILATSYQESIVVLNISPNFFNKTAELSWQGIRRSNPEVVGSNPTEVKLSLNRGDSQVFL